EQDKCSSCESDESPFDADGMPFWRVTEPHLALWLHDKPMFYKTAKGTRVGPRLTYHSDSQRPDDTNSFNFGPYWNCSWLAYIDLGQVPFDPDLAPFNPLF